jgi:hypothetical protein
MSQRTVRAVLAVMVAAAIASPACAADESALAEIRAQIRQMKEEYESRIRALEIRLKEAEAKAERAAETAAARSPAAPVPEAPATTSGSALSAAAAAPAIPAVSPMPAASPAGSAIASANAFNPAISVILAGRYANLSQDPNKYRIQGFMPSGDDIGPGPRGFNLGESEVTLSANVDPMFSGQLTFSMDANNALDVEEAFFRAGGFAHGVNALGGRFLSSIGYLNSQHAHAWDFVDAPLVYQAMLGGQYRNDGVQLKWLAPLDQYVELGVELGRGAAFPGNDRNRNGANAFAAVVHVGDDIGDSASWRAGISYLRTSAADRAFDDVDRAGVGVTNAFTRTSRMWIADAILKWAPQGNATQRNFKLQGEYFRRTESGTLTYDVLGASLGTLGGDYRGAQSGWYVQGVYQFMPAWRAGLRYDRLDSGTPHIATVESGELSAADFARLISYSPSRATAMVDWSPSEVSRLRLQLAQDKSRPGATDRQLFIQYIMSLGAHGAHTF